MLKFFIDHNIPQGVIDWLIREGYDVKLVKILDPEMPDYKVLDFAVREERILLTNDNDFVGLWMTKQEGNCILFKLSSQSSFKRIEALKHILPDLKAEKSFGLLVLT